LINPISPELDPSSVNHRLPPGPCVILVGIDELLGKAKSVTLVVKSKRDSSGSRLGRFDLARPTDISLGPTNQLIARRTPDFLGSLIVVLSWLLGLPIIISAPNEFTQSTHIKASKSIYSRNFTTSNDND
jgi:hypothetical protein